MECQIKPLILFLLAIIHLTIHGSDKVQFVTEHYPPFQIQSEEGELSGFSVDVVKAMTSVSGLEAQMTVYPWARAYQFALTNENTIIFTISRTPDREDMFIWLGDIYHSVDGLYALYML